MIQCDTYWSVQVFHMVLWMITLPASHQIKCQVTGASSRNDKVQPNYLVMANVCFYFASQLQVAVVDGDPRMRKLSRLERAASTQLRLAWLGKRTSHCWMAINPAAYRSPNGIAVRKYWRVIEFVSWTPDSPSRAPLFNVRYLLHSERKDAHVLNLLIRRRVVKTFTHCWIEKAFAVS